MMDAVYHSSETARIVSAVSGQAYLPESAAPGQGVPAVTVGTILQGYGAFAGHEQSLYAHAGTITPAEGFTGNFLLRVVDLQGTFLVHKTCPPCKPARRWNPGLPMWRSVATRGKNRSCSPLLVQMASSKACASRKTCGCVTWIAAIVAATVYRLLPNWTGHWGDQHRGRGQSDRSARHVAVAASWHCNRRVYFLRSQRTDYR